MDKESGIIMMFVSQKDFSVLCFSFLVTATKIERAVGFTNLILLLLRNGCSAIAERS